MNRQSNQYSIPRYRKSKANIAKWSVSNVACIYRSGTPVRIRHYLDEALGSFNARGWRGVRGEGGPGVGQTVIPFKPRTMEGINIGGFARTPSLPGFDIVPYWTDGPECSLIHPDRPRGKTSVVLSLSALTPTASSAITSKTRSCSRIN